MREPMPDRIAHARKLLAGTGLVLARDVGPWRPDANGEYTQAAMGWNGCRAAMLDEDFVGGGDGVA